MKIPIKILSDLRFNIGENNLSVRSQQISARLKLYPGMLLSQIAAQTVFVWLMWSLPKAPQQSLLIWLVVTYSLYLTEFIR